MSGYKLTYFNARARGELARMIFAAKDMPFQDKRVEFADWPALKGQTPQGSMPVLEVDGKKICQSMAIARYLAREFGLYGKENYDMALVDQILDTLLDIFGPFVKIAFSQESAEEKAAQTKVFNEETLPRILGYLEKLVQERGKGGYAVGSKLTVADLALYVYIENCSAQDKLEKFPCLAKNRKTTAEEPLIAAYLKSRKDTAF